MILEGLSTMDDLRSIMQNSHPHASNIAWSCGSALTMMSKLMVLHDAAVIHETVMNAQLHPHSPLIQAWKPAHGLCQYDRRFHAQQPRARSLVLLGSLFRVAYCPALGQKAVSGCIGHVYSMHLFQVNHAGNWWPSV